MGKHAYLIIANRNVKQLDKLLSTLDDSRNDIYLLIDKKSQGLFSEKYKLNFSSVYVIKPMNIYWGSYSQIKAEINLFEAAYTENKYDYYHLLSGLDLPLANQDIIHDFFDKNPQREFITYSAALSQNELAVRLHNYGFTKYFRTQNKWINKYRNIENRIFSKLPERRIPIKEIGFGSNWVSLESKLVRELILNSKEIFSIFHNGFLVDELFIPTFINQHSYFKKYIYYKSPVTDNPNEFQGNLRYINWWDGSPYVWREKDYPQLKRAREMGHLFSRKFDENIDNKIIDKIVEEVTK